MEFLSFFNYYNVDELVVSSQTDWVAVFVTAFLSGIVAWGAAWFQIQSAQFLKYKSDISDAVLTFEIISRNYDKILKGMTEHNQYLQRSFSHNGLHKWFSVPDQAMNESPFQYLIHNDYKLIHKYLKDLKIDNENVDLYVLGYSSVESFLQNYKDIRTFYHMKFEEFNKVTTKLEIKLLEVVKELNELLYGKHFRDLRTDFNSLDIPSRALFRKKNPAFGIYCKLDEIASKYNSTKKRFIDTLFFLSELRKFANDNANSLQLIGLAQNVLNALSALQGLTSFFRTFNRSYRSYYKVNKEYVQRFSDLPKITDNNVKEISFVKFIFNK